MDLPCRGLETDWVFTVDGERTEVIEGSGGMGTIWHPLEDRRGEG
jgi:hypothetical protein